jgi:hypothetical protein
MQIVLDHAQVFQRNMLRRTHECKFRVADYMSINARAYSFVLCFGKLHGTVERVARRNTSSAWIRELVTFRLIGIQERGNWMTRLVVFCSLNWIEYMIYLCSQVTCRRAWLNLKFKIVKLTETTIQQMGRTTTYSSLTRIHCHTW